MCTWRASRVERDCTRRLRNARALADGLEATGLVSWIEARPPAADADEPRAVRLERLAFEEQVLLAHAADVLVCVHGAALTSAHGGQPAPLSAPLADHGTDGGADGSTLLAPPLE